MAFTIAEVGEHSRFGPESDEKSGSTLSMVSRVSGIDGRHLVGLAAGVTIGGKFVVERVLGVGGVGVVVAARHAQLDERVAIKLLRPEARTNAAMVARFAREARAAARIKSEHAARVYDVGETEEHGPYLVMEYLEGMDLGDTLAHEGRIASLSAVEIIIEACEALAVAHAAGIVHRDIKPENLFLARRSDGTEVIKVLDFGISKSALARGSARPPEGSRVETQNLMGSPLYMSPEQIRATSTVDHRTDIWSLGVVLYELLTGHPPFEGETITQICAGVLEREPPMLSSHVPELPDGLQAVLARCLEKEADRRFATVAQLSGALVPFAPRSARPLVERTYAILRTAGYDVGTAPIGPSAAPPMPSAPLEAAAPPRPLLAAVASLPSLAAPDAPGTELDAGTPRRRRRSVAMAGAAAAVCSIAVAIGILASRGHAPVDGRTVVTSFDATVHPVKVESDPSGARVEWNGKLLGDTPLTAHLPAGSHSLRVSREGFAPEELVVTMAAQETEPRTVRLTLQPNAAPVPATGDPALPAAADPSPRAVSWARGAQAPRWAPSSPAAPVAPAPPAQASPGAGCNPPFYFEGQKKIFKPDCL